MYFLIAAICRRCRQHLSELVSQTKSDSSAHAQLPIQQEQGEQEIVTEDLEQHAQGQVRASTIMSQMHTSLKIICIPGGRTQSRGVSFKAFHLKMTLCSRHSIVKLNTFFQSQNPKKPYLSSGTYAYGPKEVPLCQVDFFENLYPVSR